MSIKENTLSLTNIGGEEGTDCTGEQTENGYVLSFPIPLELPTADIQFAREPWPPIILGIENKEFWKEILATPALYTPRLEKDGKTIFIEKSSAKE